jgi:hypothetical protein
LVPSLNSANVFHRKSSSHNLTVPYGAIGGATPSAQSEESPICAVCTPTPFCKGKVAVTAASASRLTVQVLVPKHPAPAHPVNVEFCAAVAVSVTCVPLAKDAWQVDGQLIPLGLETTLPEPAFANATDKVYCAPLGAVELPLLPPQLAIVNPANKTHALLIQRFLIQHTQPVNIAIPNLRCPSQSRSLYVGEYRV